MDYNYRIRHKDWRWFEEDTKKLMGTWHEDSSQTLKMGEKQDD
jgi:hypothetical protein